MALWRYFSFQHFSHLKKESDKTLWGGAARWRAEWRKPRIECVQNSLSNTKQNHWKKMKEQRLKTKASGEGIHWKQGDFEGLTKERGGFKNGPSWRSRPPVVRCIMVSVSCNVLYCALYSILDLVGGIGKYNMCKIFDARKNEYMSLLCHCM